MKEKKEFKLGKSIKSAGTKVVKTTGKAVKATGKACGSVATRAAFKIYTTI